MEKSDEQEELTRLDQIETAFAVYLHYVDDFMAQIKSNMTDADEAMEEQLEPHYRTKLLPLVTEFQAITERALTADNQLLDEGIRDVNRMIILSTGGALLLAIILGFYISRSISHPIRVLTNAAVQIGKGKLDTRVDLHSRDELGTLAQTFNQMTEGLSKTTISKGFLDNILKSMADMLVVVDTTLTIQKVNQSTLRLLGFDEDELIGKPIALILDGKSFLGLETDELGESGDRRRRKKLLG